MDIKITTTDKIVLSSKDFCGEFTLKRCDGGKQKKMLITHNGVEQFADWFFATGGGIMMMPVNLVRAREFKLYFSNKVRNLEIQYTDENRVSHTETFNDVNHLFMKKVDDTGFVLIVDVDMEGQVSGLKNNLSSATQTLTGLQSEKERLTEDYNRIITRINEIKAEVSALKGLVSVKQSDLNEATDEISKLEDENKAKEKKLIELNEEKEKLKSTEEMLTLDIDATQKTVDAMKERLADNQDSVELMDDLFKQKKPITARIKDIFKDIESVEKEIGLVARFQEKLADTINNAVADTEGNGTVDAYIEAGGELLRGKLRPDEQGDQTDSEST